MMLSKMLAASDDPRVLNASTTNIKYFFDPKRAIDWDNLRGEFKNSQIYRPYKFYGDSKIAFLMLSMKLAALLAKGMIRVNSVMIPAIKLGTQTINKFHSPYWRTMARIMNLVAKPPEAIAETYFKICTSNQFESFTGKLLNIYGDVMSMPGYSGKPGLRIMSRELRRMTQIPAYAADKGNIDKVWNLAHALTKEHMSDQALV